MYRGLGGVVNIYAADGSGTVVGTTEVADPNVTAIGTDGAWADANGVWHAPAESGGPPSPGGAPGGGCGPGASPAERGENGEWMDACGQWYTAEGVPFDARARRDAGGEHGGGVACETDEDCGGGSCDRCADGSAVCGGRAFDWCRPSGFRSGGGGGGGAFAGARGSASMMGAGIPQTWLVYGAVGLVLFLLLRR